MEQGEAGHKEAIHPNQYEKHSLKWNMAMIKLLLAMKKGDQDQEVEDELLVNNEIPMKLKEAEITTAPKAQGPVICKMKPFNICYRINPQGQSVHTGGNRRPVRLLRVYLIVGLVYPNMPCTHQHQRVNVKPIVLPLL
eukprot:maker-scaffold187_size272365-snap-gene-1.26 protein:Tk10322 transcript:maker-scaffold187_size272365-snap-gene-1.26-mRNA-1 annotation:"trna -lysidine synthetase"